MKKFFVILLLVLVGIGYLYVKFIDYKKLVKDIEDIETIPYKSMETFVEKYHGFEIRFLFSNLVYMKMKNSAEIWLSTDSNSEDSEGVVVLKHSSSRKRWIDTIDQYGSSISYPVEGIFDPGKVVEIEKNAKYDHYYSPLVFDKGYSTYSSAHYYVTDEKIFILVSDSESFIDGRINNFFDSFKLK